MTRTYLSIRPCMHIVLHSEHDSFHRAANALRNLQLLNRRMCNYHLLSSYLISHSSAFSCKLESHFARYFVPVINTTPFKKSPYFKTINGTALLIKFLLSSSLHFKTTLKVRPYFFWPNCMVLKCRSAVHMQDIFTR